MFKIMLLAASSLVLLAPALPVDPAAENAVVKVLMDEEFWGSAGRIGARDWSQAEVSELRKLQQESNHLILQLRANKILVDQARRSKLNTGEQDEPIAIAGFKHLETQLDHASVRKLIEGGFTHYHLSHRADGTLCFLIERVTGDASGGINLYWNVEKKRFAELETWGSVK